MTVSAFSPKNYHPAGSMLPEAIGFAFLAPTDLVVQHQADGADTLTLLALDTDYEILGDYRAGTASVRALAAWPSADLFHLNRRTNAVQPEYLAPHAPLPAGSIERGLDRNMMVEQENRADIYDIFRMLGGAPVPTPAPSGGGAGGIPPAATRGALKAFSTANPIAYLMEAGREGLFLLRQGTKPADALEGIYIASNTLGYYWERVWDKTHGRPEWFGAVGYADCRWPTEGVIFANAAEGVNSLQALTECLALCPITVLQARFYYVDDTFVIDRNDRAVIGARKANEVTSRNSSAIVLRGAAALANDVVRVGRPLTDPTTVVTAWVQSPQLEKFSAFRTLVPLGAASGNEIAGAAGFRFAWCVQLEVDSLFSEGHNIAFYWGATVYCRHSWLHAYRGGDPSGANDFYIGFFLDGNYRLGETFAGGNASVYFDKCKSGHFCSCPGEQSGYVLTGFADGFINDIETYGSPRKGLRILGNNGHASKSVRRLANGDLHVTRAIIDNAGEKCVEITNLAAWASVDITDLYSAMGGTADQTNVHVYTNSGAVTFTGGEIIGTTNTINGGEAYGLIVADSPNVHVQGTKFVSHRQPIVLLNAIGFDIVAQIYHPYESGLTTNTHPAVSIRGTSQRGYVRPTVTVPYDGGPPPGGYVAYPAAVQIEATCSRVEINCTCIDTANVTNKLVLGASTVISAAGAFNTNCLASGVMA